MPSLAEFAEAYREAEATISSVEVATKRMPVPALNEMRYAGYHAIAYTVATNEAARSARKFYISMGVALLGIIVTIALTLIF